MASDGNFWDMMIANTTALGSDLNQENNASQSNTPNRNTTRRRRQRRPPHPSNSGQLTAYPLEEGNLYMPTSGGRSEHNYLQPGNIAPSLLETGIHPRECSEKERIDKILSQIDKLQSQIDELAQKVYDLENCNAKMEVWAKSMTNVTRQLTENEYDLPEEPAVRF
ncbi:hypothetical protein LOZ66_006943 [Ophidiomyces ophidiicola]|uniref:uncharacterized protein n=1 Tax=Ophidiomyces ophidiicola TaxID=1387563 RepID=UPI0020C34CE0|nr:uncharacterized protein LOZ57_006791 [Ophidiomyces ophidiicola]KAI1932153.1 hypothetical protein LOZ66_006943 [Ophidiomyces ophidiicola]KAI1936147.1 hypothetical protein LOZ57_006791 [Ophidiomyces ophidiicola]KAI2047726.1 hypothetical protein LOZ43_005582 [Ophidiomyces ophidiicola]KAI2083704.1 hypothetical protein LOZ36_005487 [Ophidiomyces ophidiicola]